MKSNFEAENNENDESLNNNNNSTKREKPLLKSKKTIHFSENTESDESKMNQFKNMLSNVNEKFTNRQNQKKKNDGRRTK